MKLPIIIKNLGLCTKTFAFLASVILFSCSTDETGIDSSSEFTSVLESNLSSTSEKLTIQSVSASDTYSTYVADNTIDDSYSTKWKAEGTEINLIADLGSVYLVDYIGLSHSSGSSRNYYFEVWVRESSDVDWIKLTKFTTEGTSNSVIYYDLEDSNARYVRVKCNGNSTNDWNEIKKYEVYGSASTSASPLGSITATGTFNFENWYLSVPINNGDNDKASGLDYDSSNSNYFSTVNTKGNTVDYSSYFSKNSDGSFKMTAKYTGYTTSGLYDLDTSGKYCRTELRERWEGGTTNTEWSLSSGTHIVTSTLNVESCGGDDQTYVAQMHGASTDGEVGAPATIKVLWDNGTIYVEYYTAEGINDEGEWKNTNDEIVEVAYVGDSVFTIQLKIENGKFYYALACQDQGVSVDYIFTYDYAANGYNYNNYFKTGNYFRYHDDYNETAIVNLYNLSTVHN